MYKLREWRRKSRAERLATNDSTDGKVEEAYHDALDEVVPQSPTLETVAPTEEQPPPVPKSSPPHDD